MRQRRLAAEAQSFGETEERLGASGRIVASAIAPDGIPAVTELLQGAAFHLAGVALEAGEVSLPFDFVDSGAATSHVTLTGYLAFSAPVFSAFLTIKCARALERCGPTDPIEGPVGLAYHDATSLVAVTVSGESVVRVQVTGLDVTIVVTDTRIGDQKLVTCT